MKNKELILSPFLFVTLLIGIVVLMLWGVITDAYEFTRSTVKARSLRYGLWLIGFKKSCPYCGSTITMHGFEPEERYTCDNEECEFNAD